MDKLKHTIFRNFVTLQRGFDLPKNKRVDGPYPVVASTSIQDSHNKFKVKPPGVVTGRSGSLGKVIYIEKPFWPLNTTLWVKEFKGNLPKYVYYHMQTLGLENYNSGAGVPTLNRNHLDNLQVEIPVFPTQHKIASVLSAYDDLIENNLRRIKILEEMAQVLYREWFVKFRFPGHEKVRMVDSSLGKIPEGWEVVKLGQRIELSYGKGLTKSAREEGDVPVFGSSGVVGWHNQSIVDGPGIIVGRKGNVGSVFWSDTPFYPIDTVFYVKTDLPMHYVYYNLQHQNFINNDAAVPGLNRNQAHSLPFIVPERKTMDRFAKSAKLIFKQQRNLKSITGNLRQTRDLLLPRLISGELDISHLDVPIPEEAA